MAHGRTSVTTGRVTLVLLCLLAIGIMVARERATSARVAYEMNQLHARQLELKRGLWEQQTQIARFRSLAMLLDRLKRWNVAHND